MEGGGRMKTEKEIRADTFIEAASEVESHWNDKLTPEHKEQYEQAQRSGQVLRGMAAKIRRGIDNEKQ